MLQVSDNRRKKIDTQKTTTLIQVKIPPPSIILNIIYYNRVYTHIFYKLKSHSTFK